MSAFLSLLMICLAVEGMVSHSDWRYWMSALAIAAAFNLCYHIGRFVSILEGKSRQNTSVLYDELFEYLIKGEREDEE